MWVDVYKEFGYKGLMRKQENKTYYFEFKSHVTELYRRT